MSIEVPGMHILSPTSESSVWVEYPEGSPYGVGYHDTKYTYTICWPNGNLAAVCSEDKLCADGEDGWGLPRYNTHAGFRYIVDGFKLRAWANNGWFTDEIHHYEVLFPNGDVMARLSADSLASLGVFVETLEGEQ